MSVGAALAAAREDAGLDVAALASQTRIRGAVIEALERDDVTASGGTVYARGHVRVLAKALDLDVDEIVTQFDAQHAAATPTASQVFESETRTASPRRPVNWSMVMGAALVAAVGVLVFQVMQAPDRKAGTVAEPEPTPTVTQTFTPEPSASPTESPVAVVPSDGVTVKVATVADGVSWLQVTDSTGEVVYSATMQPGESRVFRDDRRLDVVLGNAAGVTLVVNGTDLGTPGGAGEVASLTFRPGDPDGSAG